MDKLRAALVADGLPPEYGPENARIDRQIDLAITESHENGNAPVEVGA